MSEVMIWLQAYAVCRQNGDVHTDAVLHADEVVRKTNPLNK